MPKIKATDVAAKYERASAVEIRNLAAKMNADVDWSGWSEPVERPDNPERPFDKAQPYEMTQQQRTRADQRSASALSPRGIAAGAANLIPPVVGSLAGGATALATKNLPATMAAEGAGNALGEKARIEAMRALGLPTPRNEGASIVMQGVLGAAAPGVAAAASRVAPALYRGAFNAGVKETGDAIKTGSRLAGRQIQAHEASLWEQGMRDRVPIGPGHGGTGLDRLNALDAPHNDAITTAIGRLDASGHTATIADLAQRRIASLRAKISKGSGGAQDADLIDQWTNDLASQWSDPSGNMKRMSATEIQEQKKIWQGQAESFYKSKSNDPNQKLRAQFDAAIAQGAREHLESLGPAGRAMKVANEALSSRKPLRDQVSRAEIRHAAGKGDGGSLVTRIAAPSIGATAGIAFGGGAQGGAIGGLAAHAMERMLADPASASRLGLLLDTPIVRGGTQVVTRAPAALFPWVNRGHAQDNTSNAPQGWYNQ